MSVTVCVCVCVCTCLVSICVGLLVLFSLTLLLFVWLCPPLFCCPVVLLSSFSCLSGSFSLISSWICLSLSLFRFLSVSLSCLVCICDSLLVLFSLTLLLFVSFSPPFLFNPVLFLYSLPISLCLSVSRQCVSHIHAHTHTGPSYVMFILLHFLNIV